MSGRRPVDRPPSPDTLVVDLDDFEEFDFDASVVVTPPPPTPSIELAQGSETHDRSEVKRQLDALSKQELDALLFRYLLDGDADDDR